MRKEVLRVEDLDKSFFSSEKGETVHAVDHVSFSLHEGEFLGLVGESGCGKSTIAKLVMGMLPPDEGSVAICGSPMEYPYPREVYKSIQMIFQMPKESFNPRWTMGRNLIQTQKNFGVEKAQAEKVAYRFLELVGLESEFFHKYPRQMSGGECQRAAIARALCASPTVLICDEITSSLDVSVQAQIIELLISIRKEMNLSVLFISHDLALVSGLCDNVLVMNHGKLVESGSIRDVLQNPREAYTKHLMGSILEI